MTVLYRAAAAFSFDRARIRTRTQAGDLSLATLADIFVAGVQVDAGLSHWQIRAAAAEGALMIPSAMQLRPRYPELKMPVAILRHEESG